MIDYLQQIKNAGNSETYPLWSFADEVARQTAPVLVSEEIPTHRAIILNGEVVGMAEISQSEQAQMYAKAVTHNTTVTAQAVQRIVAYRDECLWESANNSQGATAEFAARLYAPNPAGFISDRQRGVWDAVSVLIVAGVVALLLLVAWAVS